MRTRNETYSSQIMRERNSVSKKVNWLKSSENECAGANAKISSQTSPQKTRKTSVQNPTGQMIKSNSDVTILTPEAVKNSTLNASGKQGAKRCQRVGQIELKERKMKDVLGSISKYAICAIMTLSVALGQGTPKLDIHILDQKINLSEAEKKDATLISYFPGDTLQYVLTASNIGDGLMKNPEIVDPIPAGVTYVAKSATGEDTEITFSMNQGSTYMSWPPYYTVRNSKGILVKREATPEMISHIKWSISKDLTPGETSTMEFLVVVNQ